MNLPEEVIYIFIKQGFVIVSTLDPDGFIHCVAKGIGGVNEDGRVCIIDLYKGRTFNNLKNNPKVSLTAIDEESFTGYTLQGRAQMIRRQDIRDEIIEKWEKKVISRVSSRVIKDIKKEKKSHHHPELSFPRPQYMIVVNVEKIVNLTPVALKRSP